MRKWHWLFSMESHSTSSRNDFLSGRWPPKA